MVPINMQKDDSYQEALSLAITFAVLLAVVIALTFYLEKSADLYIVPDGYIGKVTVLYDQPDGVAEKFKGRKRVFEIPANGILHTKASYTHEWIKFYYRLPNGDLSQIPESPYADKFELPIPSPPLLELPGTAEVINIEPVRSGAVNRDTAMIYTIAR